MFEAVATFTCSSIEGTPEQQAAEKMAPIMSYARAMTRPGFDGTCIGAYNVLDILSMGTLEKVVLVKHVLSNRIFTLKVIDMCYLRHDVMYNEKIIMALERLRCVYHPNLESVHEVFASSTHIFVVTEVAVGVKFLRTLLKWRCIDENMARRVFRQLLEVVSLCHAAGIYHRCLTPDCIILTTAGEFKVCDFWLSLLRDSDNHLLPCGHRSVHYTAPEVWTSSSDDDYNGAKADSFSLGVILYIMLTSTRPFEHEEDLEVLSKVHRCRVYYPPYLSRGAVDLLQKLLMRDVRKRWSLAMVKLHPWYVSEEDVFEPRFANGGFQNDGLHVNRSYDYHWSELRVGRYAEHSSGQLGWERYRLHGGC